MKKIYLSFLVLMGAAALHAQDEFFMQNGSSVTVQDGGLLFVRGEVKGTGTASFNSNGVVIINTNNPSNLGRLNWETSTTFNSDTLVFNGNSPTGPTGDGEISGSGPVSVGTLRSSLYFDIAGVNVAELNILRNVTVTNKLRLDDGKIIVDNAYVLDVTNSSAANAVESSTGFGANESNYIIGKLRRAVVASGTYAFPIGSVDKKYNLAEIVAKSGFPSTTVTASFQDHGNVAGSTKPNFSAYQELLNPSCDLALTNVQWLELDAIVNDFGQWNMTSTASGTDIYDFRGHPNLSAISDLSNYVFLKAIKAPDNTPFSTDWSTYLASSGDKCAGVNVYNNSLYEIGQAPPGPGTTTNFIAATRLGSFSGFGVGGGGSTGLPVELVSLKADPIDNKFIRVSWTTATEINNAGFEVLRSEDGINFTNIGWVDGAGNSSTMLNYKLDDNNVVANTVYYYRLRQVDYDGQSDLTNIVSAMITDNAVFVISEFMPNPTENSSSFTIITSEIRDINLTVYNTLGQIITDSRFVAQPNQTNKYEVNLNEMASGTYYAIITTGAHTFNKKIVVSR